MPRSVAPSSNLSLPIGRAPRDPATILPDFDAVFVCLALLTGLLPLFLGSATGVMFIVLPALYALMRADRLWPLLRQVRLLLVVPVLAIVSTLWSPLPATTAYYSVQFALTVLLGVMIGGGCSQRQVLYGLFAAFAIHGVAVFSYALSIGNLFLIGSNDTPLVGLAGSKNTTADMACLGAFVAAAVLFWAAGRRAWLLAFSAAALLVIDVLVVISAKSAGANAAGSVGLVVLAGLVLTRRFPLVGRTSMFAISAIFAAVAALTQGVWYRVLFEQFLQASGKDEQLTGRTYLWERADVLISQRPMLGRGFGSFWQLGDLEAESIWENMYVATRMGFNFHNSIYEVLVYFGYVGLVIFSLVILICIAALLAKAVLRPTHLTILFCVLIVYDAMRFNFEALPLGVFAHNTLFLYAALAHGLTRFVTTTRDRARLRDLPTRS